MTTIDAKYLKDYQTPHYKIHTADLIFELAPENTLVKSTLAIEALPQTKTGAGLFLDGSDLELLSITLNEHLLTTDDYTLSREGLLIHNPPRFFTLKITSRNNPKANTQLNGLYVSNNTFCTQCEPHGFRRITYFLDRPDNLSRFTTTIVADKKQYPILLSNGNCIAQGDCHDGKYLGGKPSGEKHFSKWEDPFLKPSYLFALVAGNLDLLEDEFITQSKRNVTLRIYVNLGEASKATYAMEALKKSMRWDEVVYGREYDLDIFMIVAVRDFNMGAMENKGLNIFNSKYILANPQTATDADYEGILRVVAHEYFHNWSGNRVTCRDWFQLSLKEGFTVYRDQCFTADHTSAATKRIDDVNTLRNHQFAEDAGPMAHPVLPESYIEMNNFYTVTIYEKGAELIRMMATLLGNDKFRKGTDLYFSRHDGQAVTIEHFVKAMEDASQINLNHFRHWYRQAGTPRLNVTQAYDAKEHTFTLTVQQETHAAPGQNNPGQKSKVPMHIPLAIGLLNQQGEEILSTQIIEVCKPNEAFVFEHVYSKPVVSLLRGFSAPTKLSFDYTDAELVILMQHDTDGFSRYEAAQQFALRQLQTMIHAYQKKKPLKINPDYLASLKLISQAPFSDQALQALLLTLPSEKYLVESIATVDIDAVHTAYQTLKRCVAQALAPEFQEIYHTYARDTNNQYNQDNANKRRLKNLTLNYLSTIDDGSLAWQQFKTADNMTDSLAALMALINHPKSPHRQPAIDAFKKQWQADPLVMDKWLTARASADVPHVLIDVKQLLNDPVFNIKNPNSARALLGGYAGNLANFHAKDGSGYQFLADNIIYIDTFNSQIAARLLVAFTPWRKFDPARRQLQQQELTRIAQTDPLSKDVHEVVNKMLGDAA